MKTETKQTPEHVGGKMAAVIAASMPFNRPVYYSPMTQAPLSYSELIAKYGRDKFSAACAEAKTSPCSVEEILRRNAVKVVGAYP